jgi:hypothetical protein
LGAGVPLRGIPGEVFITEHIYLDDKR